MTEVTLSIKKSSVKKTFAFVLVFVLALTSVRVDVYADSIGKLLAAGTAQPFSTPGNGTTFGDGTLLKGYETYFYTWKTDGSACTVTFGEKGYAKTIDCAVERTIKTASTCTAAGVDTFIATATYGNYTYIDKMDLPSAALGHSFTTNVTKATTTKNGEKVSKCSVCGVEEKETYYKASSITLSKTSYTYTGKVKTPAVTVKDSKGNVVDSSNYTILYSDNKKVGTATATVKFKGETYKGSTDIEYVINPAATTVSKATAKKSGFKLTWKANATQTTGYEIRYSTSSKFTESKTQTVLVKKNSTTSTTVTGLKSGKTYYVQIRTYKTVDGQKYYSDWSKTKKVTTK
jgi:hypothetical protein